MKEQKDGGKPLVGTAGKAALGLTAAAAAAYGVYLWGRPRGRQRPVTELSNALKLRLHYVPWRDVHYAYYSRAGSGRPLVFLHSINAVASAHEMRPLVQRFQRETDRPLFALEWLGFGHSDRPEIDYTPALLEEQLEHFLARIVAAPGGADVIGLSLGATYAAEVARRRPGLVHSLVAIEPTGLGDEPREIGRAWSRLLFTLPGVQRAFYDRLTTPDSLYSFARENLFSQESGVPEDFVEYGAETARVEGAARPLDDFLGGRLFPDDAEDTFQHMPQPLLVIHGSVRDRRLESYEELPVLAERPEVEIVSMPTGALPHWERPGDVMARITEFYARVDSSAPTPRG
ncbi:MAG TPA: alpha/beta hydrolase [Longimicrobiaceae bacterium]|nr:alpha/beta hydrolase [Longimicrobiaceae bacterium]